VIIPAEHAAVALVLVDGGLLTEPGEIERLVEG
jgi:hypothetical protein